MIARTLFVLAGASGILVIANAVALAAPGERPDRGARLEKMLERLDTDQSGTISFEEFSSRGDERFAKHDADEDGIITQDERDAARAASSSRKQKHRARMEELGQRRLQEIDTNSDGSISRAEHDAHQQTLFNRLDADASGDVSQAEFAAEMEERRANRKGKRG